MHSLSPSLSLSLSLSLPLSLSLTWYRAASLCLYKGSSEHSQQTGWPSRGRRLAGRQGYAAAVSRSAPSVHDCTAIPMAQALPMPALSSTPVLANSTQRRRGVLKFSNKNLDPPHSHRPLEGLFERGELVQDAAQGPDVRLLGVRLSLADLGRYVARSTHHLQRVYIMSGETGRQTLYREHPFTLNAIVECKA